jgi:hypothetical protein
VESFEREHPCLRTRKGPDKREEKLKLMIWSILRRAGWLAGILFWGHPLAAQTSVDLPTQSKNVNFQNATSTRPVKTGPALPMTCAQGELFFLTTAAAGANLYGCTTTGWSVQTGAGGGTTIQNAGTVVGMRPILNLSDGPGLLLATSDTGTTITIQSTLDTSLAATRASLQAGASLLCSSSSASATAYTCSLTPTLTTYTAGMALNWTPDVNNTGGAVTLNIDALGAIPVKLEDGTTDPAPLDLVAGRIQQVWYDGTNFRFLSRLVPSGILGQAQPACAAAVRGRFWYVPGAAGVKDSLSVCAKDATDAFAWRTLY